eukprot:TRINITY_DN48_c0_g1_i4.p1 TRINITY_DN48_c0_g1~~TRINITY_DN48_c0_g1_i4.p1  ORF type:complete len:216 (-),score=25.01 TRINITY_DN48_c0_g1_i4:708-1355(-)
MANSDDQMIFEKDSMADNDDHLKTTAAKSPITYKRKLNTQLEASLPKAYLARALVAVDTEHPTGTSKKEHKHNDMTVLQQHVSFFDRNNDGVIYPWETYQGLRAIGAGFLISVFGSFLINLVFSYPTLNSWIPSPLLPIYVKNIHKAKHGGVTDTYDTEGRFDPAKFDAVFSKYALTDPQKLTSSELDNMLQANRRIYDFVGKSVIQFNVLDPPF